MQQKGNRQLLNTAEELQLAAGLRDAVSTVHMHATRLIILPRAYSVYQFTPLQHPVSFDTCLSGNR